MDVVSVPVPAPIQIPIPVPAVYVQSIPGISQRYPFAFQHNFNF